jgi:hypothetical protein
VQRASLEKLLGRRGKLQLVTGASELEVVTVLQDRYSQLWEELLQARRQGNSRRPLESPRGLGVRL